jgi:hypothetical protein
MVGRHINVEVKKILMEVFVAWWKYYPGIRSGLRKTMKNFRISGVHAEVRIS